MDSETTTPARHQWSFRRFGADAEGQATVETWDRIYRHGPNLVQEIDERMGDLYEAEAKATGPIDANIVGLPSKVTMRTLQQHVRGTTRGIREATAKCSDVAGGADGMVQVSMPAETWKRFQELAGQLDQLVKILANNVSSSAETVRNTQKSLKKLDTQLKEFVGLVWDLNAERVKAFPPFFTDLGPLHASLYGLGCMTTTSTTTTTTTGPKQKAPESGGGGV